MRMIVTSKRCFLNKFIQRNSAEVVLNANYYIADKKTATRKTNMNPNINRNEYGEIEVDTDTFTISQGDRMGSMYHIRYNSVLDPEPYKAEYIMGNTGGQGSYKSAEEHLMEHFRNEDTMVRTYNFLFGHQLEGNGLQILIFEDNENMLRFGHIICQYLSMTFGVDITYLDAACHRKNCNGYPTYQGNKEYGAQVCAKLMDYDLVFKFNQAVSQSEYHHNTSNIREFLATKSITDLMYLYNLLYPDAPLPPGNYSEDQIREILVYRASLDINTDLTSFSNVLIQHDWCSVLDRMSQEAEDYGMDDTGLF